MPSDAKYLPLDALAETLGLPRAWLRREANAGRLPFLQLEGRRMFDPVAVRLALAERSRVGAAEAAR